MAGPGVPERRRTQVAAVHAHSPARGAITRAAQVLQGGGLVAFPTETVYGIGANALDPTALARVFEAKGRPADNPLIVHVGSAPDVHRLARDIPPQAKQLMRKYWPGRLTLVLHKRASVPGIATGGLDSVAVRMPAHAVARRLIVAAGVPLAAPSANRSGRPSPTTARHVLADLDGRIDMLLDGGPCSVGVESTVLDLRAPVPRVLRPGAVSAEALTKTLGKVVQHGASDDEQRASPGTRYRHYKPRARVELFPGPNAVEHMATRYRTLLDERARCHLVMADESATTWSNAMVDVTLVASRQDPAGWAKRLYEVLRESDARGDTHLLVEVIEPVGIGAAVVDRLTRAASP